VTGVVLAVLAGASLIGVNLRLDEVADVPQVAEAGFEAVRTDLFWNMVETEPGSYDFSRFDAFMDALRRHRLRPVLILDYGNPHYDAGQSPRTPAARAAFARFAGAAARRYAGRGVVWEIWNEPNIQGFWTPRPDAAAYVALVAETAAALRAADPSGTIAGLSLGGCVWDRDFVRDAFAAGLLNHVDAVSLHLYPAPDPEGAAQYFAELRAQMRAAGRELPILCTEMGSQTHDEARQWEYLSRMTDGNLRSGLPLTIWYSFRDDEEGHFGMVGRDGHRKLAFYLPRLLPLGASAAPPAVPTRRSSRPDETPEQCRQPAP
jgi:polysaccharide biosynthesis protein PslG